MEKFYERLRTKFIKKKKIKKKEVCFPIEIFERINIFTKIRMNMYSATVVKLCFV